MIMRNRYKSEARHFRDLRLLSGPGKYCNVGCGILLSTTEMFDVREDVGVGADSRIPGGSLGGPFLTWRGYKVEKSGSICRRQA